jgi:hypothetical protein
MPIMRFWLFRLGLCKTDANGHRSLFGETWLSEDPLTDETTQHSLLNFEAGRLIGALGFDADYRYSGWNVFVDEIFPRHRVITNLISTVASTGAPLNINAPEACFRLQRVGVDAAASKGIGRICLPILTDASFTDLPHRRQVDTATVSALVAANIEMHPKSRTVSGKTYSKVIFSRSDLTWTPLDHYNLLPNPVRLWQRWRTYDYAHRADADATYTPREL